MTRFPVVVGFGGINPAGRSSGHHGYRRMVFDALDDQAKANTVRSLGALMGIEASEEDALSRTLIRQLEHTLFDPDKYRANRQAHLTADS